MLDDVAEEKVERVMAALLQMKKLDLGELRRAYEGRQLNAVAVPTLSL